jgi:Carbohydrate esterase, sialic acid-specific acetylesterase
MKLTIALTLLAWLAAVSPSLAAHYQVYLIGGQSNGNGRADAAQLKPPLSQEQPDVRLYYRNLQDSNSVLPEDQWINLAPGSGHGGERLFPMEFGPEVSFGRTMADAKPTEKIAIIKCTYGGSNLFRQWAAGGKRYKEFVSTVQDGLAALTAQGHTYVLRGMLWQQGEADTAEPAASNYQTNLTNLIARVRADLNGGVAFPFVIGSLSNSQYRNITNVGSGPYKVRTAQQNVADTDPTVDIAVTDGFGILPDGIHFNHEGQVALGKALAARMLELK